ncbi:MAG: phosphoribosylanthranilate isomerase [Desulfobacteraceae bacterium]|nr:phosphoribosylanthranilate isomerase [Desulfobacteraceae bacterium]
MTGRTRVKVCGITEMADALGAVELGADGLGFIFAGKSPRYIEPERAREIIRGLPPFVQAVGVFVNEAADVVSDIMHSCGLTIIQLHGTESPRYCESLSRRVVKSFAIGPETAGDGSLFEPYAGVVAGYLLDTYHAGMTGGTGRVFDWSLLDTMRPPGPVILAGGLNPDNVGAAIRTVRPFAVDVSSGVESRPGRKDLKKLAAFMAEIRKADG